MLVETLEETTTAAAEVAEVAPETTQATAPEAPAQVPGELRQLPLDEIYIGGNYRTSMSAEGIAELAESITHSGLIQPVTVRPLAEPKQGKYYALVAGARRYAAHQRAGLAFITCNVRPMSEQQAEEARLIENLQRENPHPADEAVAVGKLATGKRTNEEIARILGKTVRWVAQRRAVSHLAAGWMKLLRADKLTLGAAEELARWPLDVQQRLAIQHTKDGGRASGYSEGEVRGWLSSETHQLSAAPWSLSDEKLYPQAGPCLSCPKRSSCAGMLFEQPGKGKDTCLDRACWAVKLAKQTERAILDNSTDERPAVQLSSNYYQPPAGSLAKGRYEVVKKKEGRPGVYVDGPEQGHVVYVKVSGPPQPEKNNYEKGLDTRRARLTKETTKQVLAGRVFGLLTQADDTAAQARLTMLGSIICRKLLSNRTALDELTFAQLVRGWGWEPMAEKTRKAMRGGEYQTWVRGQIAASAPTEAKLVELLLFVEAHIGLTSEYDDHQNNLVKLLGHEALTEGLSEASTALLHKKYDPTTLREYRA
jgi:ParB/RepB/Spo0J family partition protein